MMSQRKSAFLMLVAAVCLLLTAEVAAGLFDDRFPSARVMGMGGSGVALNNGPWAAYYNPAGLSSVEGIQAATSYQRMFNLKFFQNYFGAAVMPLPGRFGAASVSVQYFGVEYQGEQLSTESTFMFSHGIDLLRDVQSSLSFGYNLKAYYWSLGTSVDGLDLGSTTTFGLDVGFQASVYSRTHVGLYVLNINSPQVGEFDKHDLPQRVVLGVAYQPYSGVTTSLDLNRVIGVGNLEAWGGAEFQVFEALALRFGGTTNPNRFSFGVGLNFRQFNVDYGLKTHSELGETHQFGLMYSF